MDFFSDCTRGDQVTVEQYLQENIDAKTLEEAQRFVNSKEYEKIQRFTKSEEFKKAKAKLLETEEVVHKDILQQIDAMQDKILQQSK